jgi:hypothetical protein
LVDENGLPVRLVLTAGQEHGLRVAQIVQADDWHLFQLE